MPFYLFNIDYLAFKIVKIRAKILMQKLINKSIYFCYKKTKLSIIE